MTPDPRGRSLLIQLASQLDQLQELEVVVRSQHASEHNRQSALRLSAEATVSFRRPGNTWRVEGKTTQVRPTEPESGAPYELEATKAGATLSLSIYEGGKPQPFDSVSPALEALRGVTRETANVVPDLLLPQPFETPEWNPTGMPQLPYLAERARFEAEEDFDGHRCYRVRSERETGTWTLWIDRKSHLPRGVKRTREGDQIKSSGLGLGGTITRMESMHHLEVTHAK